MCMQAVPDIKVFADEENETETEIVQESSEYQDETEYQDEADSEVDAEIETEDMPAGTCKVVYYAGDNGWYGYTDDGYRIDALQVEYTIGSTVSFEHVEDNAVDYDVVLPDEMRWNVSGYTFYEAPDRYDGYVLAGYKIRGNDDKIYQKDDAITVTGDLEIDVVWERGYLITCDINGGKFADYETGFYPMFDSTKQIRYCSVPKSQNFFPDSYYEIQKEGYALMGWREKGSESDVIYENYLTPDHDMELEAVWGEQVSFTLDFDGGTADILYYDDDTGKGVSSYTMKLPKGRNVNLYPSNYISKPEKKGYVLIGWKNVEDTGEDAPIYGSDFGRIDYVCEKNTTFKAVWAKPYKVTYDANGGKFNFSDGTSSNTWSENLVPGNAISLYYGYETSSGYYGDIWMGYGTSDNKNDLVNIFPSTYQARSFTYPEREGYVCVGWQISGKENEMEVNESTGYKTLLNYTPTESVTLKAIWEKTYTVTLDYNGGADENGNTSEKIEKAAGWVVSKEARQISYNKIYKRVGTISKNGYGIIGWREKGTNNKTDNVGLNYKVSKNVTLEAIWAPEITITYEAGSGHKFTYDPERYGDQGSNPYEKTSVTALAGQKIHLNYYHYYPECEDETVWCYGWKKKGDSSGKIYYINDEDTAFNENTTLVAAWGKRTTITFDSKGGYGAARVKYGDFYSIADIYVDKTQCVNARTQLLRDVGEFYEEDYISEVPIKPGYKFTGWKEKGSIDNKLYQAGDFVLVKKDMTFEAQWKKSTDDKGGVDGLKTVTYLSNGGKFADKFDMKSLYSQEESSWRAFFISGQRMFSGKDSVKVGYLDTNVTAGLLNDIYKEDGADTSDDSICEQFRISRENYTFAGWRMRGDKSGKIYKTGDIIPVSEDITFIAVWKDKSGTLTLFEDVNDSDKYFYKPVYWAYEKGITTGTSPTEFSPDKYCTREQFVTFLWRYSGSPEPKKITKFSDVDSSKFYYKAVMWAAEQGITTGYNGTDKFGVGDDCTREQCVTFIYRAAKKPKVSSSDYTNYGFTDAKSGYYKDAVTWAAKNGVTKGVNSSEFGVGLKCTRGQLVTFLQRYADLP